jgi:VCBS repeat-containing protein
MTFRSRRHHLANARPPRSCSLRLENLESRLALDGSVQAFVSGGSLQITGDAADNEILIEQHASRSFIVSSRDGTTQINGQSGPVTFTGVRNDLNISLADGNDVAELVGTEVDPLWVVNRLSIRTGAGDDQVLMTEVHALRLSLSTGDGADTVNLGNDGASGGIIVTKAATIDVGSGPDNTFLANSLFKRSLSLNMGSGDDETSLQRTTVRKRSAVMGGSGTDTLNRQSNHGKWKVAGYEQTNNTVNPTPSNSSPVASDDAATVTQGQSTTISVAANDTSATSTLDLTSISIVQTPTSGTAVANSDGTVTYTNNGNSATSDGFQYTIKDQSGNVSNAASVSITVNASALMAVNDQASVVEDARPNTATGNVLTNDTGGTGTKTVGAVNGSAANVGVDVAGAHGSFHVNADGTFTYNLNNSDSAVNALNAGKTLTDSMPYTASAGSESSSATLTVTIQGTTDSALAAADDAAAISEDASPSTVAGNVLTNDTGATAATTVTAANGSSANVGADVAGLFGTFHINADGAFVYTLDNTNATVNALSDGDTLTDSMPYTASDGSTNSNADLRITIQGHSDTPVTAVNDAASVTEDDSSNSASGNLLSNDPGGVATKTVTAVGGSASNVGIDVAGQFGTFHINSDGAFTYTLDNANSTVDALNEGDTLTDSITSTASDGSTQSTATLQILIQGATG